MRAQNTKNMIALGACAELRGDDIAAAVDTATEAGIVVPSILRSELEEAGYELSFDPDRHAAQGYKPIVEPYQRLCVYDEDGELVAQCVTVESDECLLHAVHAYLREQFMAREGVGLDEASAVGL